jgi:hypothetical protein
MAPIRPAPKKWADTAQLWRLPKASGFANWAKDMISPLEGKAR